jgi:hypothetical protein
VEHHTKNERKKYYKRIQDVTQEFKPEVNTCRGTNGKILTEKKDIQRRWKEYFKSVLTANPDDTDSMIFFTAENEDIQPSYEEVTRVTKCLKSHKAPGTDQILAELLKKGGETLQRRTHHLIKLIWVQHKMPEEWSMGIIQPIYKKGDKLECSNYRAITLLNVTYKVLSGILYNRLTACDYYYYYCSATPYAEFWPSQTTPSMFFYPGQGSSSGTFNFCISFLKSSSQSIFGLPIGLLEMGFQECTALTILVSCILSL